MVDDGVIANLPAIVCEARWRASARSCVGVVERAVERALAHPAAL